jgi:hypothetical protein
MRGIAVTMRPARFAIRPARLTNRPAIRAGMSRLLLA